MAILHGREEPISRRTLATRVAAAERDATVTSVPDSVVDTVELTLHHTHLPKLEDAGLLTYDQSGGRVEPRRELPIPSPLLDSR